MSITFTPSPMEEELDFDTDNGVKYCNFANTNAVGLIRILGLGNGTDEDYCGSCPKEKVRNIIFRIDELLRDPEPCGVPGPASRLCDLVRPYHESGGAGTGVARLIEMGTDTEAIRRRLQSMRAVFQYAEKRGLSVSWG